MTHLEADLDDDFNDLGFVLLHGSELGSWIWDMMLPHLQRHALAIDLPGRGSRPANRRSVTVADAIRSVTQDVETWNVERVILVAHSFSGILLPALSRHLHGRVAALVFVGASVPVEGKSWVDLLPLVQRWLLRVMYRLRPAGMLSPEATNRKYLCTDLDDATTRWFLDRRVPEAPHLLLDEVPTAAIEGGRPIHYIRLTRDLTASEGEWEKRIQRLDQPTVHDIDSGHLPMLSVPKELSAVLEAIGDADDHTNIFRSPPSDSE